MTFDPGLNNIFSVIVFDYSNEIYIKSIERLTL